MSARKFKYIEHCSYLCCLKSNISASYFHRGSLNRCEILVLYKALDTSVGLTQEGEEGLPVVLPELLQFRGRGELAAAELEGDLHGAVPDVVVVLHASCQRVPGRPVGCPVLKLRRPDLARIAPEHPAVVEAVDPGQMLEHVVIGGEGGRGEHRGEDGVRGVVEGVAGHQRTAVNVSRKHKLDFADPFLEGLGLWLRLLVVLFEVIGEVPVQIKTSGIVSSLATLTRALAGDLFNRI